MRRISGILREGLLSSLFCLSSLSIAFGQIDKYVDPLKEEAVKGRLSILSAANNYNRLPLSVKEEVRPPVYNLGTNSAGVYVDFTTDADHIQVRYKVKGSLNMPHMPTTGVSGVDLYAYNSKNFTWEWAFGQYKFTDTITYDFNNIGHNKHRKYRLYLPLYNSVDFLEIGVNSKYTISMLPKESKPIIIYGTSIAQGACATRPGLAWTNILGRMVDQEVVNLGFSGNGRLEQPILNLINDEDASVFVLDCIPNLSLLPSRNAQQLDSLIKHAVHYLRNNHKHTPIVLLEHSSAYTDGFLNIHTMQEYGASSKVVAQSYKDLRKEGDKNIYLISAKDIGLDINSTVDYAHPNDIGMMKIAEAYHRVLKKILK